MLWNGDCCCWKEKKRERKEGGRWEEKKEMFATVSQCYLNYDYCVFRNRVCVDGWFLLLFAFEYESLAMQSKSVALNDLSIFNAQCLFLISYHIRRLANGVLVVKIESITNYEL